MTVTVKVPAPDHLQKCLLVGLFPGLSWQVFIVELPQPVSLSEKFREPTKQESTQPLLCVCVWVAVVSDSLPPHGLYQGCTGGVLYQSLSCPTLCHPMDCTRAVQGCTVPGACHHQAPPSTGFPRQEYQNGGPFPSPGHLPSPGIKPRLPALQADSPPLSYLGSPDFAWLFQKHDWFLQNPGLMILLFWTKPLSLFSTKECQAILKLTFQWLLNYFTL